MNYLLIIPVLILVVIFVFGTVQGYKGDLTFAGWYGIMMLTAGMGYFSGAAIRTLITVYYLAK